MCANDTDDESTVTKRDAIEAFRDKHPHGSTSVEEAAKLATPWGVAEEIREWRNKREEWYPNDSWEAIPSTLAMRMIVGNGTDERPMTGDEYHFGNNGSCGGHKKAERGAYKGNLSLLERDAGVDMTHGLTNEGQNHTDPCEECGRTCIYRDADTDEVRCVNCGTKPSGA